jgi:hypothetical protein
VAKPKQKNKSQMELDIPGVLYDQRFLESHVGCNILHDPKTAIVELIANAWDAGATKVDISWPCGADSQSFAIKDNGTGMTNDEFQHRWRTLSYNRQAELGPKVVFPETKGRNSALERMAFGRNGIGRWSGFCFGDAYTVETCKNSLKNRYQIAKGTNSPFQIQQDITDEAFKKHGTQIGCPNGRKVHLADEDVRAEIGMRFLTDPNFCVSVNGVSVSFEDIDDPNIEKIKLDVGDGKSVELIIIDTQDPDRTIRQHGVAWHVGGRLVGSCSWKGTGADDLIDGRRIAAKRFTFVVRADHLAQAEAIKKDWTGFDSENEIFQRTSKVVYEKVREYLLSASEEDRKALLTKAKDRNKQVLETMGPLEREKWTSFVTQVQEKCPSVKESDIVKLSEVVANLEQSKSGYALVHKLSEYGPDQLDDLHKLLDDWTLDIAKQVLDEIGRRLKLVEEIAARINDENAREVQDLQPLFEKGLWIFGPEFETIEYTSNQGMTRVVQDLFNHPDMTGTRLRPDFAVLPDGTCGLYTLPKYDETFSEIGTDRLVIIELKKPTVTISSDQKAQCWKYVKELYEKGLLQSHTTVKCFALSRFIDPLENDERTERGGKVSIQPMLFETVLHRAKNRLLKLYERVKSAPFLEKHRTELDAFLAPVESEPELFTKAKRR